MKPLQPRLRQRKLPEHPNAEPHRRLMERLRTMTPEEAFQMGVSAGIYTPSGRLRKPFRPGDELPAPVGRRRSAKPKRSGAVRPPK